MRIYFNSFYNPLYDLVVAPMSPYRRLQKTCVDKIQFSDNDYVLCIGVGTGNEIPLIISQNRDIRIIGLDMSTSALIRAKKKATKNNKEICLVQMDAHRLEYADEVFDKVVCIHVMGFLEDDWKATHEILRVLKKGGQFVITYPSGSGSVRLTGEIMRSIYDDLKLKNFIRAARQFFGTILGGIAYAPGALWVKPKYGFYSQESLKEILSDSGFRNYEIEEDRAYQDYIVYGEK